MSEEKGTASKQWTEAEKLGILFQIIAANNEKIPWDKITMPEGRTLKAVQVMVDKEKAKVRAATKAKSADGNEDAGVETPATPASTKGKKRASTAGAGADGEEGSAKKKPRTPRKKKTQAKADEDEVEMPVKAEAEAETAVGAEESGGDDGGEVKTETEAEA